MNEPIRRRFRLWLLLCLMPVVASCSSITSIHDVWIRLPAVPGRPAAAYFDVIGGSGASHLVKIEGPFQRAELHETVEMRGMSGMRPLPYVLIPHRERVSFEPGGKHAMLFGWDPRVAAGATVELTFFEAAAHGGGDGAVIATVPAMVVEAGAPSPYQKGLFGLW